MLPNASTVPRSVGGAGLAAAEARTCRMSGAADAVGKHDQVLDVPPAPRQRGPVEEHRGVEAAEAVRNEDGRPVPVPRARALHEARQPRAERRERRGRRAGRRRRASLYPTPSSASTSLAMHASLWTNEAKYLASDKLEFDMIDICPYGQPEPPAALPPRAAARRPWGLVLVGEPRVELAAREAREQHHRVEGGRRGLAAWLRRRRAGEEDRGEQEEEGREAMLLRLDCGALNLLLLLKLIGMITMS
jgi:hypothetical protein